jgi:hypothetical protein
MRRTILTMAAIVAPGSFVASPAPAAAWHDGSEIELGVTPSGSGGSSPDSSPSTRRSSAVTESLTGFVPWTHPMRPG